MPLVNAATKTLQVKIVYYGPGLSGKTTNLEQLSTALDPERVGELMSLDTTGDRTLFFDWMPLELGQIKGFDIKIQLYTVPGQVRYNNTRKKVLSGVDGLVFVADSQVEALEQNRFSFQNLRENLAEQAIDLEDLPLVIQWNKRDLPTAAEPQELAERLNLEHYPQVEAVASEGRGVRETLRMITRLTIHSVRSTLDTGQQPQDRPAQALDGHSLMDRIMSGESSDVDFPEILPASESEDETDVLLESGPDGMSESVQLVRQELGQLRLEIRELRDRLPARVADAVEREVEPTAEKVADIESRLGIMQRVVSRYGNRLNVLERRVARMEMEDQQFVQAQMLRELAVQLESLAKLMGTYAHSLSQQSQAASQPVPRPEED